MTKIQIDTIDEEETMSLSLYQNLFYEWKEIKTCLWCLPTKQLLIQFQAVAMNTILPQLLFLSLVCLTSIQRQVMAATTTGTYKMVPTEADKFTPGQNFQVISQLLTACSSVCLADTTYYVGSGEDILHLWGQVQLLGQQCVQCLHLGLGHSDLFIGPPQSSWSSNRGFHQSLYTSGLSHVIQVSYLT